MTLELRSSPPTRRSLQIAMDGLWTTHVVRTRQFLEAAVSHSIHLQELERHLMSNQDEIGAAWGSFYGSTSGARLGQLLREHIGIAKRLTVLRLQGRPLETSWAAWVRNADSIAAHLARDNVHLRSSVRPLLHEHLVHTKEELETLIAGSPLERIWDQVLANARQISRTLSEAIALHFGLS